MTVRSQAPAKHGLTLFGDLSKGDHFLTSPLTLGWLREEIELPGLQTPVGQSSSR
jgi:hypothetical protein